MVEMSCSRKVMVRKLKDPEAQDHQKPTVENETRLTWGVWKYQDKRIASFVGK